MIKFLARYGNALFLAYMGGGILFLILIDSIFNGGFDVAVRLLWAPLAILVFGFTWWYRYDLYDLCKGRIKVWVGASLTYPILVLMGWPYVMAYNAMTPTGHSIAYSGQIISKWVDHYRQSTNYHVVIMDRSTHDPVTFEVCSNDFALLSIGDSFQRSFHAGGLGIPYRWRHKKDELKSGAPYDR